MFPYMSHTLLLAFCLSFFLVFFLFSLLSIFLSYTQEGSDDASSSIYTCERKNEPIRPGDCLLYYSPVFAAGDKRGKREATVISVDPKRNPILMLSNSEHLPENTQVCRVKIM